MVKEDFVCVGCEKDRLIKSGLVYKVKPHSQDVRTCDFCGISRYGKVVRIQYANRRRKT